MPAVCLITGASSGIGAALAEQFAARGHHLVLTARRRERLEALATGLHRRHGVAVTVISCDLADPGGVDSLLAELHSLGLEVTTLINNAGFGLRGDFAGSDWSRDAAMLQLMLMAPARLCHQLLPPMLARGSGTIINVASLAGLVPGLPGSTLYSATKAFLIRFSQSLAAETAPAGLRVLAVCPGYVRSEFHAVLGVEERMQRLPGLFWMDAGELARRIGRALDRRTVVQVPGLINGLIALLARLLPEAVAVRISAGFSRRYRGRR